MNIGIILAGGKGTRLRKDMPKQFIQVKNKPILFYSIETFEKNKNIDEILIISNQEFHEETKKIINKFSFRKVKDIIFGGDSRKDSVFNALKYLNSNGTNDDDIVLIHDSARAMVDQVTINNCIKMAEKYNAATAVQKTRDTIVISDGKLIKSSLNRDQLFNVQTPQVFKFGLIYEAHYVSDNDENITDDTRLVKNLGKDIHIVISNNENIKITTENDLYIFETYLNLKNSTE